MQEANRQGKEVAIQIGEEGFTLLRNENKALPLGEDERKVSVFGRASSDKNFWYMGLGSGSGPKSGRVTLYGGLEEAGLELAPALKDKYNSLPARTDTYSDAETGLNHTTAYELYEPGQEWLNEDGMLADAAENYPTAIVVIGRGGRVVGKINANNLFLHGTLDGPATVNTANIFSNAQMTGTLAYYTLNITGNTGLECKLSKRKDKKNE